MANDRMDVSSSTAISMPMRNLLAILAAVAMGIFAYTEITARLTSLETSRELFQADLLKKSEQLPTPNLKTGQLKYPLYGSPEASYREFTLPKDVVI